MNAEVKKQANIKREFVFFTRLGTGKRS